MVIFVEESKISELQKKIAKKHPKFTFHKNETKPSIVRNAENKVFWITCGFNCRGTDYRLSEDFRRQVPKSRSKGLDLLIASTLPNKRAYI